MVFFVVGGGSLLKLVFDIEYVDGCCEVGIVVGDNSLVVGLLWDLVSSLFM